MLGMAALRGGRWLVVEPTSTALVGWLATAVLFAPFILLGLIVVTFCDEEVIGCDPSGSSISPSSC